MDTTMAMSRGNTDMCTMYIPKIKGNMVMAIAIVEITENMDEKTTITYITMMGIHTMGIGII